MCPYVYVTMCVSMYVVCTRVSMCVSMYVCMCVSSNRVYLTGMLGGSVVGQVSWPVCSIEDNCHLRQLPKFEKN